MKHLLKNTIQSELGKNLVFKDILNKFELPQMDELKEDLDLVYKSNEYMGYYKKEMYFDLIPKKGNLNSKGTLKITFVSSVKQFDIEKAMHAIQSDETHNVSITFMLYNEGDDWDTARYNYTLWKNA
ncbi:MAG: hypothetical protein HFJ35_00625 [Clostridia bacterium]|nr:hypothetical protein [Clostridia bacterium]